MRRKGRALMRNMLLNALAAAAILAPVVGFAQSKVTSATYITDEEVKTVNALPGVDRTIRVVDVSPENFAVGVIHRGASGAAARGAAPAGGGAATGRGAGAGAAGAAGPGRGGGGGAAAGAGGGRGAGAAGGPGGGEEATPPAGGAAGGGGPRRE